MANAIGCDTCDIRALVWQSPRLISTAMTQTEPGKPPLGSPGPHPVWRLIELMIGNFSAPPGRTRIAVALAYGALCHLVFAAAILAMVWTLWNGMMTGLGAVPFPYAILVNAALVLQFPLLHSLFLNGRGAKVPGRVLPGPWGKTLAATTYTIFASLQLLALFLLWTPSGIVWWRAEGAALWVVLALHVASWLFLVKSNLDAGAELQSGALGWMSLVQLRDPAWPDMPTRGLFTLIRQPIYVGFTLVLWTVPTWTPDQLAVAAVLTAYCLIAPARLKEPRYLRRFGAQYARYRDAVPYMIPGRPRPTERKQDPTHG
ncbi:isoprenylcysteine carboxylmethyltransferase family protein [Roseivivax marinus]|uniref:methyltransferase family protein n=1 Tax=Roseivivax marinus TaxID=1379903 RepID=UPI001F0344C3|nr:isoprenylcysteine carboxylmethyltransferase family protein [Roseivivax marinus]UMA65877.1 isoprenylcysteine carboxylmethyltransferase family protein [Roseivivax marinus]